MTCGATAHSIWLEFASQFVLHDAAISTAWKRGALQPQELQATRLTMKMPSVVKAWTGFWSVDVVPSSKSHCQDVGLLVDRSVKNTSRSLQNLLPCDENENSATGFGSTVTDCWATSWPQSLVAVSVTVY